MTLQATEISAAPATFTCAHCGNGVPAGLINAVASDQFCCGGCRAVYQTLHACGLEAFYRLRDVAGTPARPSDSRFDAFDSPAFGRLYVRPQSAATSSVDLVLEGLTCFACVWLIERLPRVVPGVIEARLSLRQATVRIVWEHEKVSLSRIALALDGLGYTPHPAKGVLRSEVHRRELRKRLISLGVAGAIAGNNMLLAFALYAGRFGEMADLYRNFFRWISVLLGAVALAWPGAIFFRSAMSALRLRRLNLDVPIALALLAGGIAGGVNVILNRGEIYFDTLSVLVLLLLAGRFLQFRQQRFADDSLELLFSLAPMTCRRISADGSIEELPVEALSPGDLIEVRSGDTVAADGMIEAGQSSICQALLTGESQPVLVGPGDEVFGGAQNQGASLRARVTSIGQDTRIGRLMKIVEEGTGEKPAIVQLADRIGAWFTLVVCVAALLTFTFWSRISLAAAIDHSVALLIVTCPCVLGLATPLTIAMAIGQLARRDILIKRGAALEILARTGHCLLDKTGTLTFGTPRLVCWEGDEELKGLVVAMERQSRHPLARALVEGLKQGMAGSIAPILTEIEDRGDGGIRAVAGRRIVRIGSPSYLSRAAIKFDTAFDAKRQDLEQAGMTVVFLAVDDRAVALAALGDELRPDAAAAVAALGDRGWRQQIISGDAQPIVASIARAVGIEAAVAQGQMTPEAKVELVRKLRGPEPVVMVGDGVNDAATLAAADVGIAVHGGAEVSMAAADIYIAAPGMSPLVFLVDAARKTMRTVHRNLVISLTYNLVAGALAAAGRMSPLAAAVLMPISSASVLTWAMWSMRSIGSSNPIRKDR